MLVAVKKYGVGISYLESSIVYAITPVDDPRIGEENSIILFNTGVGPCSWHITSPVADTMKLFQKANEGHLQQKVEDGLIKNIFTDELVEENGWVEAQLISKKEDFPKNFDPKIKPYKDNLFDQQLNVSHSEAIGAAKVFINRTMVDQERIRILKEYLDKKELPLYVRGMLARVLLDIWAPNNVRIRVIAKIMFYLKEEPLSVQSIYDHVLYKALDINSQKAYISNCMVEWGFYYDRIWRRYVSESNEADPFHGYLNFTRYEREG